MKNQKAKAKNYCEGKKEKLQERLPDYYRNLPENGKIRKEIMLTMEIKTCQKKKEKERKNIWETIIIKEKICWIV